MSERSGQHSQVTGDFSGVPAVVNHVLRWFEVEEEEYASVDKFGYERNLAHLTDKGVEPGSTLESQLTGYWFRAVNLDTGLRDAGRDTVAARQYFAKHTNAIRSFLSTTLARLDNDNYEQGKRNVRDTLVSRGEGMVRDGLLFAHGQDFDPGTYYESILGPIYTDIHSASRGYAIDEIPWEQARDLIPEHDRLTELVVPLTQYLLPSFDILVSYVASDGPLPKPGLTSGELETWTEA